MLLFTRRKVQWKGIRLHDQVMHISKPGPKSSVQETSVRKKERVCVCVRGGCDLD
jgi:hypothetical protein